MHGQRIGYARVSSLDQNLDRQLVDSNVTKVFTDKASGKDTQRSELERLLSFVREGDTVVVHSMDRLARNLDDLRRLVQTLTKRGVRIEFVKERLTFVGEDSLTPLPQARPDVAVLAAGHLMFAVRETAAADNSPEPGRQYLRDSFGLGYWGKREVFVYLLDWLAALGNAEGMQEWINDSDAARILAGRLRNDQA